MTTHIPGSYPWDAPRRKSKYQRKQARKRGSGSINHDWAWWFSRPDHVRQPPIYNGGGRA